MSASISDPFLLSSYALPKRINTSGSSSSSSKIPNVFATPTSTSSYVTVAAQGDGIHIVDATTLHPEVSHTLGPSVTFSCHAVTRTTQNEDVRTCTTYAVLESGPDISAEARGRTVWIWDERLSGNLVAAEAQKSKRSVVVSHRVSQIFVSDEFPEHVLLVGEKGEMTVANMDLNVQHSHQPSQENGFTIKSFAFSRASSHFVPQRAAPKQGAVLVSIIRTADGALRVQILAVGDDQGIVTLGDLPIPIVKSDIVDSSCSGSGWISILARTGEWSSFQLESADFTTLMLTPATPLSLQNLSFIPPIQSSGPLSHPHLDEISLLSVGSSHVLLASSAVGPTHEITLLLWDLQYSVVLASHVFTIPSTVHRSKRHGISLHFGGAEPDLSQALLVLSPGSQPSLTNGDSGARSAADSAAQKSSVLVVPFSVPPTSTIANALGRAPASNKWIAPSKSRDSQSSAGGVNDAQDKVLKAMSAAVDSKRIQGADEAFFAWVSEAQAKVDSANAAPKKLAAKLPLGHQFVKRVLEVVLRSPKNPDADILYSPKVVRYLLEKRLVSAGMVPGGLFSALRLRKDWESMILALKTVVDLSEADVVSLIQVFVSAHGENSEGAMQVDESTSVAVPSLPSVLSLCLSYPTSAAALRLAIRQQLRDSKDLTCILQILSGWLDSWCEDDVQLLPERTKKDLHGALVPVLEDKRKDTVPPVNNVLAFLQTLLDSSYLAFLSYQPSHDLLQHVLSQLLPEVTFSDEVEQLRGPLMPFVKAHTKAVHESAHGVQKPDLKVDWKRRRKQAHEQASIAVGVYQIEELVL